MDSTDSFLVILSKFYPELFNPDKSFKLTNSELMDFVKNTFTPKFQNDIEDLLMSQEIKFADSDTALNILKKQIDTRAVLDVRELMIYKILPCPYGTNCVNKPPEIVPHNEYMDQYLECSFYHHEKDKRRVVLCADSNEDFTYKANYQKSGDSQSDIDAYSKNFFESLFHPIFYKLFPCKRKYCNGSYLCPFRHSEKEKNQWDEKFFKLTKKQRDIFLKEKSYVGSYVGSFNGSLTSTASINSHEDLRRGSIDDLLQQQYQQHQQHF
eukprot:CAMPEP_0114579946 /NCGR_PEP_ID=MMETSP0125-20121206/4281_1 /TAXON_ID=485358 ORGANISM="Aristerostoma sp., Strain ATCC 50986" /NCGR_SAMPLE_ID=MMETSP0125 /ASSEMBLY_ACC=CAM_ASM_000245 /LENGTH=266 /DNA_ID=CAMNT_0001771115 /DNA_START=69 /DNA_END=872 /DNA_ORIENTATION=-